MASELIYNKVTEHYSAAVQTSGAAYGSAVAKTFGYSEKDLADVPEGSNLGLSCGNPLALASITKVNMARSPTPTSYDSDKELSRAKSSSI